MRIGVISDTHIPNNAPFLPSKLLKQLQGVDLILHAGDLVTTDVLGELSRIARVEAVYGNMDTYKVCKSLPAKKVVEAGKFKVGLMHGRGAPDGLMDLVLREFKGVDVIVFGHSHRPVNELCEGILLFNPGSPTDKVYAPYNSFGFLNVEEQGIKGEIIRL